MPSGVGGTPVTSGPELYNIHEGHRAQDAVMCPSSDLSATGSYQSIQVSLENDAKALNEVIRLEARAREAALTRVALEHRMKKSHEQMLQIKDGRGSNNSRSQRGGGVSP
ncbi:MAG: hypothetical protein NZ577_02230, partial [Vicinamibacterales bacterium]|nr:hypothetical protein [Vicinamibacterales bacterium]